MNEKEIKEMYEELKRNKKIIKNIDTDFFFKFAETVLNLLEKKDKIIKNQSYTNKKMRKKLQGYRKLLMLKEKHLQKKDKQIEQYQNMLVTNDMLHVLECEKKDKMIDDIQKEVREHISFENMLKRDNREPDLFNQGRFYVANNINNILK